jgi:hypothetical protein
MQGLAAKTVDQESQIVARIRGKNVRKHGREAGRDVHVASPKVDGTYLNETISDRLPILLADIGISAYIQRPPFGSDFGITKVGS